MPPALKPVVLIVALFTVPGAQAQSFEIPPVGTDETFNVATWNIEHFGTSGPSSGNTELQFQNVLSVMQQANVHLWALQEMQTLQAFNALVSALGEGWAGVWQADMTQFSIGYGFIYRSDLVQPLQVTRILTDFAYEFAYRPPLLMRANLTLPGGTVSNVRFINLHAKCCGDQESWFRRRDGSIALKNYVDNLVGANLPVVILGDLNDRLMLSIYAGATSPYANFRLDDENYHFGTLSLELAGINTWCGNASCTSGSTIDHVLITKPLFDDYVWDSTARYDALLANIPSYRHTTSDHVAVYSLFDFFNSTDLESEGAPTSFALSAPYPNPFREHTTLSYTLPRASQIRLEVFDALGRRVTVIDEAARPAGTHEARLASGGFAPGLYLIRLTVSADGGVRTATRRAVRLP